MSFQLAGIDNEYRFELRPGATLVVGRALTSDCSIVDPTVSRRHAELTVEPNGVQVTDAGSSNGTFVNGVKVERYFVVPGETIAFGRVEFRLEELAPVGPPANATTTDATSPTPRGLILRHVPESLDSAEDVARHSGSIRTVKAGTGDATEKDRQKLQILLDVSKGLTRTTDVSALLGKVADYAFQILEADRCAILLMDDRGELRTRISRDRRGADAAQVVPQSIARTAVEQKVAVLSDDAAEDPRFTGQSVVAQRVRSALCAPLIGAENRVLGALYVDNVRAAQRFDEADLDFVIAFAGIAAVAIENGELGERSRREALVRENFERFFTPQLAARIANGAEAVTLGGDRRNVAVLFSDIRGFAALAARTSPDAIAMLLTEYFTEMVECVFRRGGTLDKFIGDAVMALWGAPIGAPDDADHAMAAARDMMAALDRLNERWTAQGRPTVQIGIGLNFGEAFAGNIGSERRLEYTVIGDTVNMASRLCRAAGPGEILVSEAFRTALRHPPPLAAKPVVELRGVTQPAPVYAVVR
jgi:adenylate cyclase